MYAPPKIQGRMASCGERLFVPAPQECMGRIIGTGGRNIKQLERETRTKIKACNGDRDRGPGFLVTGIARDCENAQVAIQRRIEKTSAIMKEPVPQQFVRLLIKRDASDNFRAIEKNCGVKITWSEFNGTEQHVIFDIKGSISNCEQAREMIRENIKKWKDYRKSASPVDLRSNTNSKGRDVVVIDVPKEYIPFVLGLGSANKEKIETKTETKIIVPPRNAQIGEKVQFKIIGQPNNCHEAKSRIRQCMNFHKQKMLRHEYGGDKHFVCFAYQNENETFRLKPCESSPKFDDFIQRQRYRIETEFDNDDGDDDPEAAEISEKTISDITDHLTTPLETLKMLKDEKQLLADLWCHFGKSFVSGVDEEHIPNTFTPTQINGRIKKMVSKTSGNDKTTPDNQQTDGYYWKVSFEEGIDPTDINDDQLPKSGDENRGFLNLKLVHTQWRYDFGFITPTCRNVRLKVWEGLPPDRDEPPVEVKNILRRVFLQGAENILAWICHPSISVLRGEIMIPKSPYDCRIKLRAGSRYETTEDSVCIEEDGILSDYLSNCTLDQANHCMSLPDEKEHEKPEGFDCVFYREAKERMYEATVDGEWYTVIVLDEKGWDSDATEKRLKEQFGIRVVMKSWSEAMLSSERRWTTEEILEKLKNYMTFLSLLQDYLFGNA